VGQRRGVAGCFPLRVVRGGLKENGGRKEFQISNFKFKMRPNADPSTELALIFQGMRDVSAGGEGEVRLKRGSGAKANFAASGRGEVGLSAGSRASQVRWVVT
jgi:hypothetical protein